MKFMKKYIFILLALVTLGLAGQGCTERLDVPDDGTAGEGTCLNFSVEVPGQGSATRAAISEQIKSLWVLVFDENDFFVECKQATPDDPNAFSTDENTEYKFKVTLQASPAKRTLHFVANYDFDSKYPDYNHEYYLMSHLTVTNKDAVPQTYWQKLVLSDGIPSEEEISNMTAAEKQALQDRISKIPLVRNFAKVHLESTSTSNFTVKGFALLNVPDRGSVAPCVMSASDFAVYQAKDTLGVSYPDNPWISRSYDQLSESYNGEKGAPGFEGYLPSDVVIDYSEPTEFTPDDKYMYERPYSGDDSNTSIIVWGQFTGSGAAGKTTYYKIDFVKAVNPENGFNVYYNILRNFLYDVTIKGCTSDGYDTVDEAVKAPSMNNFLFSVDTQDYSNISDGKARIFVEYTEKTIVDTSPFEFKLKYIPDISSASTVGNKNVKVRDKSTKQVFNPGGTYTSSESAVVKSISLAGADLDSSTDSDGWLHFKVTPQALPSSGELTQSVVFYVLEEGSSTDLVVARTVILHLRKPFEMKINMDDSADKGVPLATGTEFLLNLYIPTGLNKSVFPLEFKIESATNNLTPNSARNTSTDKSGYMSTWTGTSISPSATATYGKQTFGFTKSITYDEYNALSSYGGNTYKIVPCAFKTTKATTSGANVIYVSNPYFTPNPTSYSAEQ